MRIVQSILLIMLFNGIIASVFATQACPDIKKMVVISKELVGAFKQDYCAKAIKPLHLQWIRDAALPKLMNKSFLGVEPPPNWQELADEISQDCVQQGNMCTAEVQRKFAECLQVKTPIILMQLGPWFTENCKKLNATVIENWADKRKLVLQLISEFEARN